MDKKIVNILLMIVLLLLLAVNIVIFINNNFKQPSINEIEQNNTEENTVENVQEEIDNTVVDKIVDMNERERMQTYFGSFIKCIEAKEYDKAYAMLNETFKTNYFPTINDFENYMQKYPKNPAVNYQNIERQGEIFVLMVEIKDIFDNSFETISQRVVIRELGLNQFTLSFQVEEE